MIACSIIVLRHKDCPHFMTLERRVADPQEKQIHATETFGVDTPMLPPGRTSIHTEYFHTDWAITLIFVVNGVKVVDCIVITLRVERQK